MSEIAKVSLMDVHSALSHLVFAVSQSLAPLRVSVSASWDQWTYLSVSVECYVRDRQKVVDKLRHGALVGPYDYRFTVSYPLGGDDADWIVVKAYPDMARDDASRKSAA